MISRSRIERLTSSPYPVYECVRDDNSRIRHRTCRSLFEPSPKILCSPFRLRCLTSSQDRDDQNPSRKEDTFGRSLHKVDPLLHARALGRRFEPLGGELGLVPAHPVSCDNASDRTVSGSLDTILGTSCLVVGRTSGTESFGIWSMFFVSRSGWPGSNRRPLRPQRSAIPLHYSLRESNLCRMARSLRSTPHAAIGRYREPHSPGKASEDSVMLAVALASPLRMPLVLGRSRGT